MSRDTNNVTSRLSRSRLSLLVLLIAVILVLFAAIVSSHLFDSWKYNAFISREIKDVVIGTPVENGRFEIDANSLYSGPIDVLFSIALRDLALSEDALIDLTVKKPSSRL
jgi:nitrogen fixation/metabolism regulation signal transduction histidine kinase